MFRMLFHTFINRHWHGLIMLAALATLAMVAPQVNAASGPPRSVFVPWPETQAAPKLYLTADQYADGSWYLDLTAKGFAFSDFCQAVEGPQTIGHAHVFQGERKIASAFVPRVPLGQLKPGRHEFSAMLRAQDHRALIGSRGLISARIVIEISDAPGA